MFTSLSVTLIFTVSEDNYINCLTSCVLEGFYHGCLISSVELYIDMAVLCGGAGKHLVVPTGICPYCGAVLC
jgi:hypothetical protein